MPRKDQQILNIAEACDFNFSPVEELGNNDKLNLIFKHTFQHILSLDLWMPMQSKGAILKWRLML